MNNIGNDIKSAYDEGFKDGASVLKPMTVYDFSKMCRSRLRVLSAYNGKVLCYEFHADKHKEIGKREILNVWAAVSVSGHGYSQYAYPHLCCYVDGHKECEEAMAERI